MFSRSHILNLAATIVLSSAAAFAQMQGSQGTSTQTPPGGMPSGSPQSNVPGNTGISPDLPVDPYTTDKDFVKNSVESSATEVYLGKLAQDKASSESVKELGKKMVDANTQTEQQMKQAAAALKIQVADDPPRKAKKAEDKLSKLSGADFDRAYAKIAADEQKQAVKQFEREAKSGRVPEVKDFAAKNLSAEQERQKQAEELASEGTGSANRQK